MAVITKITIATLLCSLASAADCASGSCAIDDQTSLLQKQQVVTEGASRRSTVDEQEPILEDPVHEAYDINRDSAAAPFANAAEIAVERDARMAEDRIQAAHHAAESIENAADSVATQAEIERDNVRSAAERHAEAVAAAAHRVHEAEIVDAEADHEKHMVEDAAVYGRHRGLDDGLRNAHHIAVNAQNHAIGAAAEHNREERRLAAIARHEAAVAAEEQANQNHIDAYGDAAEAADVRGDAWKDHMAHQAEVIDGNMARRTNHFVNAAHRVADDYDAGALGNEEKSEVDSEEPIP